MNSIDTGIRFIEKYSNKKNIIAGFLLILFVNIVVFPFFPELFFHADVPVDKMLDVKFGFSLVESKNVLSSLGPDGRSAYLFLLLLVDVPYALIYGFTFSCLFGAILKRFTLAKFKVFILLPFVVSFFDVLENAGVGYLIREYPHLSEVSVAFTSTVNMLKWISAAVVFFIFVILLMLRRNVKNKIQ